MDTLRIRRRPHHLPPLPPPPPPPPPPPLSALPKAPLPEPRTLPSLSTLANLLQFAIILTLLTLNLSHRHSTLHPSPAPPSSLSSPVSSNSPPTSPPPLTPPFPSTDIHVTIYAYDRPRHLHALLLDLAREADAAAPLTLLVHVIDDNSYACVFPPPAHPAQSTPSDLVPVPLALPHALPCAARPRFARVEALLQRRAWRLSVARYRHARRRYWALVRAAHAQLRDARAGAYLFLPDDVRLARGFFGRVMATWTAVRDGRKVSMMLHVEESRETVPVWTGVKPRNVGGGVSRIGWVESGNFVCAEEMLRFMNWSFPQVPAQRWVDNPTISSGVGAVMSGLLHQGGKRMYRTQRSYVAHVGVALSKMNARFRKKGERALVTKYFADGDDRYEELLREAATVTASIASHWQREEALHAAVHSLAHQVDHLNVYLNGYDSVPSFLNMPYITVLQSSDKAAKGNIGDIGKFFWCNDLDTEFHLTADDDIVYPPDYVSKLLSFYFDFKAPVVVGVHGIRVKPEDLSPSSGRRGKGYYGSREVWMAVENVPDPVNVHIIGTGTMLYRPADIGSIDLDTVFQQPNMADVWFGLLAQRLHLPMMVIPHSEGWIQEVPGTFEDSIYKRSTRSRHSDRHQTIAAKSIPSWTLYKPSPRGR